MTAAERRLLEETALRASAKASEVLRRSFDAGTRASRKGEVDLVTEADREAERAILDVIRTRFPDHGIVAEESGTTNPVAAVVWYVDPLDGTTNFVHGFPHFAVSIAALCRDGFATAVVEDPLRRETFRASRGTGAFRNERPISVSSTAELGDALVASGFPYDRRSGPERYLPAVERVLRRAQGFRRAGAASLDLAYVACGRLDAYWEQRLQPWDTAAGSLLVEEAGGTVTSFDGAKGYPLWEEIAASNAHVHQELLAAVRG